MIINMINENKMCTECYIDNNRITPLLNPISCLCNHIQYICGTCGRCICINKDLKSGLQRWRFPFKSLEIAKMYLRTADYTMKKPCGIYEIQNKNGKMLYKIFTSNNEVQLYLRKNKDKYCKYIDPIFIIEKYMEYKNTQVRKLNSDEIQKYISEMSK